MIGIIALMNRSDPRLPFLICGGVSLMLVVFGVLLAEFMRLAACPLCIWQRILYLLIALLAGIGLLLGSGLGRRVIAFLMTTSAATGAGIAAYQTWLQSLPIPIPCGVDQPWWERFVNWAGEQLPLLFKGSGLCSDPSWVFIGLSIAQWSLLLFLGLLALSGYAALRKNA